MQNKNHEKIDLKNLTPDIMARFLKGLGKEEYRVKQIMKWIYPRGVDDFDAMSDLAKSFRLELAEKAYISSLAPKIVEKSSDGTRKYLFPLDDGHCIETVLLPMDKNRHTLCVSTQVGCAMKCSFCLTGTMGLERNLNVAEIVNQVCAVKKEFSVDNIVLMGMGEPLHNLENVISALEILYSESGFNFSPRKVTLSTCGIPPAMEELGKRVKVNLAVSLNASTDHLRNTLMPINLKYPLSELMEACRHFPLNPRQRITFEYILLKDINDSLSDAKRLVRLLHGIKAKINLIPFNSHPASDFKKPSEETILAFQKYLLDRNIVTVRRVDRGQDISAACGQLKTKNLRD